MVDPPRSDERLDVWFARRLQAKGISPGRRFPAARIAALGALGCAVIVLLVVLWGAQGSSSSTPAASTATTPPPPPASSSTSKSKPAAATVPWNQVRLTVLNGTTTTGLAGTTQSQLESAGWNVVGVGDATSQSFSSSVVVYPPGKRPQATAVANKLHLSPPVALAQATGVPSGISTVTLVVGSDGLPSG